MQHDRPAIPSHPWSLSLARTTHRSQRSNSTTGMGTWPWRSLPPTTIGWPKLGLCPPPHTWEAYPVVTSRASLWQCGQCVVLQQVWRCTHILVKSTHRNTGGALRRWLWQHPTRDTRPERLPGLRTSKQHTRFPHEDKQRTTSTTRTQNTRGLYTHGLNTHYNQTLPTTNPADHDNFEASHRHQLITALTRTKTCWQVCLHSHTTLWKGRQSSKQSIVWSCLLQSYSFRQTYQTRDTSYDWRSTTRAATCRSTCPNHLPTNHHLHRCVLPDWRGTQTMLWTHRGRLTTCTQRPTQWMGYSRILSRRTAHCYQRPCPSELTSPVHILQSLHILPRSLDSRHRTSFIPTTPDPTLYPIVRQRGIKTCHHQGYRQTPATQQHHWSSLDMA